MWITAKDERVCPVCGPLHGQKVLVNEQFKTAQGDFWSPGLHPNCRCVVRLIENRFSKRDDDWEPKLHPRDEIGRFSTRTRTIDVDEEFGRMTQGVTALDRTTADPQQDLKFLDITHHGVLPLATARVDKPRPKTYAYVAPTLAPATAATKTPVATVAEPKAKVEARSRPRWRPRPRPRPRPSRGQGPGQAEAAHPDRGRRQDQDRAPAGGGRGRCGHGERAVRREVLLHRGAGRCCGQGEDLSRGRPDGGGSDEGRPEVRRRAREPLRAQ